MMSLVLLFAGLAYASAQCVDEARQCILPGADCRAPDAYTGPRALTKSGDACVKWSSQGAASAHGFVGLGDAQHSFCRNPDRSKAPWCYVNKPNKLFEYCFEECTGPAPTSAPTTAVNIEPEQTTALPFEIPTIPDDVLPETPITVVKCAASSLSGVVSGIMAQYGADPAKAKAALDYYTRNIAGIRPSVAPQRLIAAEQRLRARLGLAPVESWELFSLPSRSNGGVAFATDIVAADAEAVVKAEKTPAAVLCTVGNSAITAVIRMKPAP